MRFGFMLLLPNKAAAHALRKTKTKQERHHMKEIVKKSIALCAMTSLLAGCTSTTVIHSRPEGAKIYIDDMNVGKTPYTQKDTKIVGTHIAVRLKMDGYEPFETQIYKNEKLDVGAIIAGCFVYFPFIWIEGYQPEHTYELTPIAPSATKQ
jgi:hypothetical protein